MAKTGLLRAGAAFPETFSFLLTEKAIRKGKNPQFQANCVLASCVLDALGSGEVDSVMQGHGSCRVKINGGPFLRYVPKNKKNETLARRIMTIYDKEDLPSKRVKGLARFVGSEISYKLERVTLV